MILSVLRVPLRPINPNRFLDKYLFQVCSWCGGGKICQQLSIQRWNSLSFVRTLTARKIIYFVCHLLARFLPICRMGTVYPVWGHWLQGKLCAPVSFCTRDSSHISIRSSLSCLRILTAGKYVCSPFHFVPWFLPIFPLGSIYPVWGHWLQCKSWAS